jgi:acyl-coenzyme A thioesterase 13
MSPGVLCTPKTHCSYFKSAKKGDDVLIEASVTKTGKKLAFMEVEIKNGETGDLLAKGTHTAFIL